MAKRARELAVKEKRERKKARKEAQRDNPGEGTTADPSEMRTWLAGSHVRCTYFTSGSNGHGTVLATVPFGDVVTIER